MQLEQLITKFQKKDEKAFEKLYHMYSSSMHGVMFNIVRDNNIAEPGTVPLCILQKKVDFLLGF